MSVGVVDHDESQDALVAHLLGENAALTARLANANEALERLRAAHAHALELSPREGARTRSRLVATIVDAIGRTQARRPLRSRGKSLTTARLPQRATHVTTGTGEDVPSRSGDVTINAQRGDATRRENLER